MKGSIRSHDDITADTEEDQKQKLQRAGKKLARDLEIFSDWFLEQTASLTERREVLGCVEVDFGHLGK